MRTDWVPWFFAKVLKSREEYNPLQSTMHENGLLTTASPPKKKGKFMESNPGKWVNAFHRAPVHTSFSMHPVFCDDLGRQSLHGE